MIETPEFVHQQFLYLINIIFVNKSFGKENQRSLADRNFNKSCMSDNSSVVQLKFHINLTKNFMDMVILQLR